LLLADPLSVNSHLMEEARFSKTMRGRPALFDKEGYRYVMNRSTDKVVYWKCEFSSAPRGKCPGYCVTDGFFIKSKTGTHIHKPDEAVIKTKARRKLPLQIYKTE
jgi:hypothetical protein